MNKCEHWKGSTFDVLRGYKKEGQVAARSWRFLILVWRWGESLNIKEIGWWSESNLN